MRESAWLCLLGAGLLEIGWAWGLKASENFSKPGIAALTVAAMILSFILLGAALRAIPIGTAYAIWTGIGAVGTVALGILVYGESRDPLRLACIGLIVAGIAGLKLLSPGETS